MPFYFPQSATKLQSLVTNCGQKCDVCDTYLQCKNEFISKLTGKTYKVGGHLCWNSANVIYLLSCKLWKAQYAGSPYEYNFKSRLGYIIVTSVELKTCVVWMKTFWLNVQL